MCIFYIIALVPVMVGAYFWLKRRELAFIEWIACVCLAFLLATAFHFGTKAAIEADYQIVSGRIEKAIYYPEWVERYQVPIYRTVCSGSGSNRSCHSVFSHYETRYRTHHKYWEGHSDISYARNIKQEKFNEIQTKFQNLNTEKIYKSGFYRGDPNIYVSYNKSNILIPINETKGWSNPVKGKRSLFNFVKISKEQKKSLHKYPKQETGDWFVSNRLLGGAIKKVSIGEWDKLNSELFKTKKVNLFLVEFDAKQPRDICLQQEALWLGGKNNDVVLCYKAQGDKVLSSYVFGWTESEILKRNLETILLESKIDNSLLGKIKSQVESYYVLKDFSKYKYISTNAEWWVILIYILLLGATQFAAFMYFLDNELNQGDINFVRMFKGMR